MVIPLGPAANGCGNVEGPETDQGERAIVEGDPWELIRAVC